MIDYFHIKATTAPVPYIVDSKDTNRPEQSLNNLFAADPKHPCHKYYRGWANVLIHFINQGRTFDTDPHTIAYGKALAFYNEHRADLWTGFIDDVALYGEERDTATLKTEAANDTKITFTLTSKMDPAVFDYPLTVKVRLPRDWKGAAAKQNNVAIPVEVITHEGSALCPGESGTGSWNGCLGTMRPLPYGRAVGPALLERKSVTRFSAS